MALVAAVAALTLPHTPAPVDELVLERELYPECQTARCERRVGRKRTLRRWRHTTQPYRAWLRSTRMCESGGRYWINTGNGFFGAYQFTLPSWRAVGGYGYPHQAQPLEQDYRAVRLLWLQGTGAWPVCG